MEKKTFRFKADGKANSEQGHTPTSLDDGTFPDNKNGKERDTNVGEKTGHKKKDPLGCQLWNDLDHLIDIDKLYPSFQVLCIVVPYKLGLLRSPKERTRALI